MPQDDATYQSWNAGGGADKALADASAEELDRLLSLAEEISASYRRARGWSSALLALGVFLVLVEAGYLLGFVYSSAPGEIHRSFRDPAVVAWATALLALPAIAIYYSRAFRFSSWRHRETLHRVTRVLHEVERAASGQGRWSPLHQFSFEIRLSRLEIG